MIFILLLITLSTLLYWYFVRPLDIWKQKGIPYSKAYPIVGNFSKLIFQQQSFADISREMYAKYPNEKIVGGFMMTSPSIMVRDVDILKNILIKDFDHFMDHTDTFFKKDSADPMMNKFLFVLNGNKWHEMRSTLSPAFTGSKMRGIFAMIQECSNQFVQFYTNKINNSENGLFPVELKDVFTRFSNDVIATAAFGIKVDSFNNPDNEFFSTGRSLSRMSLVRMTFVNLFPRLMKLLNVNIFPTRILNYFRYLAYNTITYRERNNIIRPDMIHLLMEARKGNLKGENGNIQEHSEGQELLSNDDIAAQAFLFFLGGFDTVSTAISFTTYELAINPEIQNKLLEEIEETFEKAGGSISYDHLKKMKYMDQVISESLRKWPPAPFIDRRCTKDYEMQLSDGRKITIEKNMNLNIPVYGIHRDPKYYPNPDKFDPDRFSDENKSQLNPDAYMPFGSGPRICIASRFALMEVKTALLYTIKNFELIPTIKTQIPPKLSTKHPNMIIEDGFHIALKLRTK